jgi:hypothetical protein
LDAKTAASRGFSDRCATEIRLANSGAVVVRLESVTGHHHMTIPDLDQLIVKVVPKQYKCLRDRAILVLSQNHVYVEEAGGLPNNALKLFARGTRIVCDSVIDQLEADPSFFDDLDAPQIRQYKPFLKLEGDRLVAWRRAHPSRRGANIPSSVFNHGSGFKLAADVSSTKTGLRSGGADDLEPVGDFLLKDLSWKKKEPFNFEKLLLPNGPPIDDDYIASAPENSVAISAYSLPALKAVHRHFSDEVQRYTDAVSARTAKGFLFDWRGKKDGSQKSLQRALRCESFRGAAAKVAADYVGVLDAKIKEFKAAAAAA